VTISGQDLQRLVVDIDAVGTRRQRGLGAIRVFF